MRFDISCIKTPLLSFLLPLAPPVPLAPHLLRSITRPQSNGHNVTYILVVTNVYIEIYRLFHCFSQFFLGMTSVTNIIEPCQFVFTCSIHYICLNVIIYFVSDDITYNHRQSQKTRNHFSSTHKRSLSSTIIVRNQFWFRNVRIWLLRWKKQTNVEQHELRISLS